MQGKLQCKLQWVFWLKLSGVGAELLRFVYASPTTKYENLETEGNGWVCIYNVSRVDTSFWKDGDKYPSLERVQTGGLLYGGLLFCAKSPGQR